LSVAAAVVDLVGAAAVTSFLGGKRHGFTVALILAASAAGVGRNGGWPWQPCVRARGQYCWADCTRSLHSRHCKKTA
jgi:hypothetical protein